MHRFRPHVLIAIAGMLLAVTPPALPDAVDDLVADLTRESKNDSERAVALLKGAELSRDAAVQAALLERAAQLGVDKPLKPEGRAAAETALRKLADLVPDRRTEWNAMRVAFCDRWFRTATGPEKATVGAQYVDALFAAAADCEAAGDWKEAMNLYRRARTTATGAKLLAAAELSDDRHDRAQDRQKAQARIDRYREALQKDPTDARARLDLVKLLLVEMDDPAAAASHAGDALPEPWRTRAPLAGGPVEQAGRAACKELGDWYYRELMAQASAWARIDMEQRAKQWYERFLTFEGEDADTVQVRVALDAIATAECKRLHRVGRYIEDFARKRARLPADKQVEVTQQALSEVNGGIEVTLTPETEAGQIVGLSVHAVGLVNIEPLYGLPLRKLMLGPAWDAIASTLRSFRGVHAMDLDSLTVNGYGPEDLAPLRGLRVRTLELTRARNLRTLDGAQGMPLEVLRIETCDSLESLAPLKGIKLRELVLSHAVKLATLEGLEGAPLETVSMLSCSGITSLAALKGAPLKAFRISLASQLKTLEGLENAPLEGELYLMACSSLESLAPLKGIKTVTSLRLDAAGRLTSLEGVEDMPLLSLWLSGCTGLTSLKGIEGMPLQFIDLRGCAGLGEEELARLKRIATLKEIQR